MMYDKDPEFACYDEAVHRLTPLNFDLVVGEVGERPILVEFWAGWCEPGRSMAHNLNELAIAESERLRVAAVDVELYPDLADRFSVRGIPALVLFRDGLIVWEAAGAWHMETLLREVHAALEEAAQQSA